MNIKHFNFKSKIRINNVCCYSFFIFFISNFQFYSFGKWIEEILWISPSWVELHNVRGYPEMAQKVIEGDVDTWRHMHEILRWPKIRIIQFLFNFGSKYQSREIISKPNRYSDSVKNSESDNINFFAWFPENAIL